MVPAAAFGPVLAVPGKQPPRPSDPSGTFDPAAAQPAAPTPPGPTTLRVRISERALPRTALPRKVARTL